MEVEVFAGLSASARPAHVSSSTFEYLLTDDFAKAPLAIDCQYLHSPWSAKPAQ
jgi:hypothetical protein